MPRNKFRAPLALVALFMTPAAAQAAEDAAAAASAPGAALSSPASKHVLSPIEYRDSFRARWQGLPHTAPRYDDLTKPTRVPYPAACITNTSRGCLCYSQDGSRMYLPESTCSRIVYEGIFLDFEPDAKAHSGKVLTSGAVTWSTKGAPLAGGQPSVNHVPGTEREQITPGDIAKASTATTGSNIYARDAVKVADAPTRGSPRP